MLFSYVGEETFLKGVSLYLKNHLYGNSVSEDLWKGIQAASSRSLTSLKAYFVIDASVRYGYPEGDGQLGQENGISGH